MVHCRFSSIKEIPRYFWPRYSPRCTCHSLRLVVGILLLIFSWESFKIDKRDIWIFVVIGHTLGIIEICGLFLVILPLIIIELNIGSKWDLIKKPEKQNCPSLLLKRRYGMHTQGCTMVNFKINLISDKADKKIPISLVGQMMMDMQNFITHVGEFIMGTEMHIQKSLNPKLLERTFIYMDSAGGMSIGASSRKTETSGHGDLMSDIIMMMERTMDAAASDEAALWFEENYTQNGSKTKVINDVLTIANDVTKYEGFSLVYGSDSVKTFKVANAKSLQNLIKFTLATTQYGEIPVGDVEFKRLFATNGDVQLKAPVGAFVQVEPGKISIRNNELGISVTKSNWDDAIQQFNDYFVFLWLQYSGKDDSALSDEEKEIKSALLKFVA